MAPLSFLGQFNINTPSSQGTIVAPDTDSGLRNMTKSYQSFEGKLRSLKQHLQLMDMALKITDKHCRKNGKDNITVAESLGTTLEEYPQLNMPAKVKDIGRAFATSRIKVNEQAIIELYAAFSDYLVSIIHELAHGNNRNELLCLIESKNDNDSKVTYKQIFDFASFERILDEIANRVYRNLENSTRSTPKMLNKILSVLNIQIPDDMKEDALLHLEVRHLIIHNNSKIDDDFNNRNNNGRIPVNTVNKKIIINYALSKIAIEKVLVLCKKIDDELIAKSLLKDQFPTKFIQ